MLSFANESARRYDLVFARADLAMVFRTGFIFALLAVGLIAAAQGIGSFPKVEIAPTSKPIKPLPSTSTATPNVSVRRAAKLPRDVVGVAHVAGKYNFSDRDYLNEGADVVLGLGSRVIKVWFADRTSTYKFNTTPPQVKTLLELAQTQYFAKLFTKPFSTIILVTYSPGRPDHYYLRGMSDADVKRESDEMFDLTKHLLTAYKNTGKTFVLQNWQGDWSLRGGVPPGRDPTAFAVGGMVRWLNARQDGVERARQAVGMNGVVVLHAAEVNFVRRAMDHQGQSMCNDVLPFTKCDLYSYATSAIDVPISDPAALTQALDYIAKQAPASELTGAGNIYIGEMGVAENTGGGPQEQFKRVKSGMDTSLQWGARYVIYWQVFCNERRDRTLETRPTNADMKGYWLIRPDGSRPPIADYLMKLWSVGVQPQAATTQPAAVATPKR